MARPAVRPWVSPLVLAAAGLWTYQNSFEVPFLFDDHRQIVHHAAIRSLAGSLAQTTRPLIDFSLALNYAFGGLRVFGYHALNLAIHVAAGLALLGCLRRTLRLALWPLPLVFDYLWPVARLRDLPGPWLGAGSLLGLTVWAWRRHPPLGFLGVWWFLLLAPTSSIVPVADLAAEHRTYLPLAGVITLAVFGTHALLRRVLAQRRGLRRVAACTAAAGAALALGLLTIARHRAYQSERALWSDVLAKRPGHFRALSSLGDVAWREGKLEESIRYFSEAGRLLPENPEAHDNLGLALFRADRVPEAMAQYLEALRLEPDSATVPNHLGLALTRAGQPEAGARYLAAAVRLNPRLAEAGSGPEIVAR